MHEAVERARQSGQARAGKLTMVLHLGAIAARAMAEREGDEPTRRALAMDAVDAAIHIGLRWVDALPGRHLALVEGERVEILGRRQERWAGDARAALVALEDARREGSVPDALAVGAWLLGVAPHCDAGLLLLGEG